MAKATPTRTLNSLPFQDLEPHRFEDLIRQLAYDMRRWKSLEATGRSGSDEGVDIRAIELVAPDERPVEEDPAEEDRIPAFVERLWIFQCKREKSLTPKRIRDVVAESLASLSSPPHGFILAVACDVSKKARDAFRDEMTKRLIEEFAIWARSELEDMLFQAKNDRLLFAYFGLSLQPRRRSIATTVRSQIVIKKQLSALLGEESARGTLVLLRDPTDDRYPRSVREGEQVARWVPCMALHTRVPSHLTVLFQEHLAWVKADGSGWDALTDEDQLQDQIRVGLRNKHSWLAQPAPEQHRPSNNRPFWFEYVPERERAYLKVLRYVPLERILAIDPIGDGFYPIPHLLIELNPSDGLFTQEKGGYFESSRDVLIPLEPDPDKRIPLFPNPLPKSLYPPPPGFDQTSAEPAVLSEGVALRTAQILIPFEPGSQPDTAAPDPLKRKEVSKEKLQSFLKWRDSVAHPIFSAFVNRLRDAGHDARVVMQSIEPKDGRGEALEVIELRVHFNGSAMSAPGYTKDGHISISAAPYAPEGRIETYPPLESSSSPSRGSVPPPPTPESMSADNLARFVVQFLERFHARAS